MKFKSEVAKNEARIENARLMAADGDWDVQDFKALKVKLTKANAELVGKQAKLMATVENYEDDLRTGTTILSNLHIFYANSTLSEKQLIISSVFTGKLVFDKSGFRTIKLNRVVEDMLLTPSELQAKKIGRSDGNSESSYQVGAAG